MNHAFQCLGHGGRWRREGRAAAMALALLVAISWGVSSPAQPVLLPALARDYYRSGEETLQVLAPVSAATRFSIVKVTVNGETVGLGTVMDTDGFVLAKASELKPGKLACWLAADREVPAEMLGVDEDEDLALLRVRDKSLKPVVWATNDVAIGQWAITPGIAATPHALGIVSAPPRRIYRAQGYVGILFDLTKQPPTIKELAHGMGAEKAGLKPQDVILAVNSSAVSNREQVVDLVRKMQEGETVKLSIQREKERFDSDIELMAPRFFSSGSGADQESRLAGMSGQVSRRAAGFERAIEHDTVLVPWLCGGPLVNLDGQAIGLNISRASRVTTYALPPDLVWKAFERLKANARVR
jgi:serine protease Do